ncbi:MAG TPA: hypothetical protein VGI93_11510 [Steroidobacteraceae bacterium]|jgi:hypothetical protein
MMNNLRIAMRNPAVAGLVGATLLLGVVGLFRAIAEYGHPGFVAFTGVLFAPVILVASAIFIGPLFSNGLLGGLIPSASVLRRLAYAVIIGGALGAAFTGLFGVGWLLKP